jgi:hypothetical protein
MLPTGPVNRPDQFVNIVLSVLPPEYVVDEQLMMPPYRST